MSLNGSKNKLLLGYVPRFGRVICSCKLDGRFQLYNKSTPHSLTRMIGSRLCSKLLTSLVKDLLGMRLPLSDWA